MKTYEIITERIIEALGRGVVPWRKPWNGSSAEAKNLTTQKPYRGINAFLLSVSPYASPYWLTFKQAQSIGASVTKGSKGYPVVFWTMLQGREGRAEGSETGDNGVAAKRIPFLRYYTVFNVDQCEGLSDKLLALIRPESLASHNPIEACECIVAGMPKRPAIEHVQASAWYRPSTDIVNVPELGLFDKPESYYATLYHELGHSTGHESRVGRKGVTELNHFGSHEYSQEELVAEMTAAFLCNASGIDGATLDNSAAYIGSWLRKLRDDKRMVVFAAAQAQKAADFILGREAQEGNAS